MGQVGVDPLPDGVRGRVDHVHPDGGIRPRPPTIRTAATASSSASGKPVACAWDNRDSSRRLWLVSLNRSIPARTDVVPLCGSSRNRCSSASSTLRILSVVERGMKCRSMNSRSAINPLCCTIWPARSLESSTPARMSDVASRTPNTPNRDNSCARTASSSTWSSPGLTNLSAETSSRSRWFRSSSARVRKAANSLSRRVRAPSATRPATG